MKKKLENFIIIILIITIIISSYFVIKDKKMDKVVEIEIKAIKIEEPNIEKISVEEEIKSLQKKYNNNDVKAIIGNGDFYIPVTQYKNNNYYLNYSIKKERSILGNPFIDYRHNKDSKQINIYGHNSTKYHPPFQTLVEYIEKSYYLDHSQIRLKIGNELKKYEIFTIYIADKDEKEEHMKFDYKTSKEWLSHFDRMKKRSLYKIDSDITETDNILVLQTCIYGKYKGKLLIVAAKEIK